MDSLRLVGGGGVVRDDQGNWVIGFARKIGPIASLPSCGLSEMGFSFVYKPRFKH